MDRTNQQSMQDLAPYHGLGLHTGSLEQIWKGSLRLNRQAFLAAVLTAAGYYLGARVGMALKFQPHAVSVMWPPNAILLGAFLLTPMRTWWLLVLAAAPAHLAAQLPNGVPGPMAMSWFASNCLEAFIGAGPLRLLVRTPIRFDSFKITWKFFFCGALLAPVLSTFLDIALIRWNRFGSESFWHMWQMRCFSNIASALIFVPVTVVIGSLKWNAIRNVTPRRFIEGALVLGLCAVSAAVFWEYAGEYWAMPLFVCTPIPFLLWAAVRFGPGLSSVAIMAVALSEIWGAVHRRGPFSASVPEQTDLCLQLLFSMISITLMSLAAVLRERRGVEEALQQSEQRYREVVDSQTDFICRYSSDTTLTFVNESYCRFFKIPRERLLGRRFIELIPASARPTILRKIAGMARSRGTLRMEHEVCLPDGTVGWHAWTDHPVVGNNGQILEFQAVGRDVTDRKRAEQAQQYLAHASRLLMLGELTAMVAHEINQPLACILSNAEAAELLLQSNNPDLAEARQILVDIRREQLRATETIRRIWTLSRKHQPEISPLNINQVISDVLRLVSGDAHSRQVHIESDLTPANPFVQGDKVQLQQVLLNLILNAMDAMSHLTGNRNVTIRTSLVDRRKVEITVADNGTGIPSDKMSEIFDCFFTTKPDGMGVGLAIARSIVEAHGGSLSAENNQDRGATFRIQLESCPETHELSQQELFQHSAGQHQRTTDMFSVGVPAEKNVLGI